MISDLRSLRTLKAIQECGTVVDAAERLFLTPSAVSHQLRELENAVGMPLLTRKTRPPKFSRAGERLLALADLVLAATREAERDLGKLQVGATGRIALQVECNACLEGILPILGEFRHHWLDVSVDVQGGGSEDPLTRLLAEELDLLIDSSSLVPAGLTAIRLYEYEQVLVVPPTHELATRTFVNPSDLAEETLIVPPGDPQRLDVFRYFLQPEGVEPVMRTEENMRVAVQLVASGRGIAAMPHWFVMDALARGWVRSVRLGRDGLWCTQFAILRDKDLPRACLRDFTFSVREAFMTQIAAAKLGRAG